MRVSMEYGVTSMGPCDEFSSGEVEDYTIQIGEAAPQAPIADFSYSMNCQTAEFNDLSTDSDGTIVSWDWDFGDDLSSSDPNPCHIYDTGGTYLVSLTVTDNDGLTNSTSQSISTLPPSTYYREFDEDGYGDPDETQTGCTAPGGQGDNNLDGDDNKEGVYPGAPEICDDGIDNNSNGTVDEGCGEVNYCPSNGDATDEYINSISIGSESYISGSSGPAGYEDYTDISILLTPGNSYDVQLVPGFNIKSVFEYWTIWIDLDFDGHFDGPGEQLLTSRSKRTISSRITIPTNASGTT